MQLSNLSNQRNQEKRNIPPLNAVENSSKKASYLFIITAVNLFPPPAERC